MKLMFYRYINEILYKNIYLNKNYFFTKIYLAQTN